jgi:hypothetical protein
MDWALKIGLINDKQINPFEKSRPDGGRGWRLSDSFLQVARKMVGETK